MSFITLVDIINAMFLYMMGSSISTQSCSLLSSLTLGGRNPMATAGTAFLHTIFNACVCKHCRLHVCISCWERRAIFLNLKSHCSFQ